MYSPTQPLPVLQPELESGSSSAACQQQQPQQQQQRPPPPGFEDSTAGSQWLQAVKLAGLADGNHEQLAEDGQLHELPQV